jgi:hypothetical protein
MKKVLFVLVVVLLEGMPALAQVRGRSVFHRDTIGVRGTLTGYRAPSNTVVPIDFSYWEEVTGNLIRTRSEVDSTGHFRCLLPLTHARMVKVLVAGNRLFDVYLEPGKSLEMTFPWNEYPMRVGALMLSGTSAPVNRALQQIPSKSGVYGEERQPRPPMDSREYALKEFRVLKNYLDSLDRLPKAADGMTQAIALRKSEAYAIYGRDMLAYLVETKASVESSFFECIRNLPLDDPNLLAFDAYNRFVNLLSYSPFYPIPRLMAQPEKPFDRFLEEDCNQTLSAEEKRLFLWKRSRIPQEMTYDWPSDFRFQWDRWKALETKYASFRPLYDEKYIKTLRVPTPPEWFQEQWDRGNQQMENRFGVKRNLTQDLVCTQMTRRLFRQSTRKQSEAYLEWLSGTLKDPFLKEECQRMFDVAFENDRMNGYALLPGSISDLFMELVKPYLGTPHTKAADKAQNGKLVVVFFWGTQNKPSVELVSEIEQQLKPKIPADAMEWVYVSGRYFSPSRRFKGFLDKHPLKHSYLLDDSDFASLQQLFRFSTVPHAVLVRNDGRILDDDFNPHTAVDQLDKLLKNRVDLQVYEE